MVQYIKTRPIFELAVADERRPGYPETMRWWEQEGIRFGNEGRGMDKSEADREY